MGRHAARRAAMQLVYEQLMGGEGGPETLEGLIEAELDEDDLVYLRGLLGGVRDRAPQLNAVVARLSPKRELSRIPVVVRAILLLSLYELEAPEGTPAGVVVNEAVELARMYGQESDGRFVNGVLGSYLRETTPQ